MSNSASRLIRFLSDENVDKRLEKFLKEKGVDIISKQKGLGNGELATFSKSEKRILITNDEDFSNSEYFPKEKIFSVVWLKIPQDKIELSKSAFLNLLKETKPEDFEGNLIILYGDKFRIESISSELT
ncbi:DUF5615 family PIN-like protein [Candidatus Pacearchaeota archaeon]|nr:DUF5615 family PIN-like protein [Candidatus Pacearchaeota archaeon]